MSAAVDTQSPAAIPNTNGESPLQKGVRYLTPARVFWIVFVFALLVFCQLQFWKLPSIKDRANWDYFAQVISRGGIPYRDVVNIKTPLSAYIGAGAVVATRPFGFPPVLATRITNVIMTALTVAFTFLVANLYFKSRRIGLLAAMILSGILMFWKLNGDGLQPKTPMILCGLISLWLIIKDRPLAAGVFGMLSALSWQPGLLFVGAGSLAFTRYLTSWRDLKFGRLMIGASAPLILFLAHLWIGGALRDFYLWCFEFNLQVYGPRDYVDYAGFEERFIGLLERGYAGSKPYFLLAAAGFVLAIGHEIYLAIKGGRRELLDRAAYHQMIIAALVYLIFCRIDLQGEQDLIPLLPFVAIFAAFFLIALLNRIIVLTGRFFGGAHQTSLEVAGCTVLLVLVFFVNVLPIFSFDIRKKKTLAAQQADATDIVSQLEPGEQIWVHGQTQLLVLSGLTNSHKYTNLDHGKDNFLDRVEPGGFHGWFERLKADRPRIVIFERLGNVDRTQDFLEWLNRDYELRKGKRFFKYYVRKDVTPDR